MSRRTPDETVDEAVRLYLSGRSYGEVGRALGLSPSTVGLVLRRREVPARKAGGLHRPRPLNRVPPELEDEAVRLYAEEFRSLREIAAVLPVSEGAVKNVLRRRRVRLRPRSWGNRNRHTPQAEVAALVDAVTRRGLTAVEAARELGIGEAAVWYRLRQAGVRLRDVRAGRYDPAVPDPQE